jgi:probable phosphoglycerate mutase
MTIYLIRHADPDYQNDTITEKGHLEAQAVAKRMAAVKPDRIYTSSMGRAKATMQYTADLLGMPHEVLDWTREIHGYGVSHPKFGQIAAWNIPGSEIFAGEPPTLQNWHEAHCLAEQPFRTIYDEICEKSDEFLAGHGLQREGSNYRITKPNTEKIALFAHYGFGLTWLAHLLHIPVTTMWSGFFLATTSVTVIKFERYPGAVVDRVKENEEFIWAAPRCICVGDTSHLYT